MSRWLILDKSGNRRGDFANPQNLNQPAYQDCTQIEAADNDPRVWPQFKVSRNVQAPKP